MLLSVVIPIHNEEEIIVQRLGAIKEQLKLLSINDYEIVLVLNGCHDSSFELIQTAQIRNIQIVEIEQANYGHAVKTGFIQARGLWIFKCDIDQWDFSLLALGWQLREHREDNSFIVTGPKISPESQNTQPMFRRILSKGLSQISRLITSYSGTDSHGPKFLSSKLVKELAHTCSTTYGIFEIELLSKAFFSGKSIIEFPIQITEIRKPKISVNKRLLKNIWEMRRLKRVKTKNVGKIIRFSQSDIDKFQRENDLKYSGKDGTIIKTAKSSSQ